MRELVTLVNEIVAMSANDLLLHQCFEHVRRVLFVAVVRFLRDTFSFVSTQVGDRLRECHRRLVQRHWNVVTMTVLSIANVARRVQHLEFIGEVL